MRAPGVGGGAGLNRCNGPLNLLLLTESFAPSLAEEEDRTSLIELV